MILQDKAVILHMPKTGGVFIRMLLQKHYGDRVRLPSGATFPDPTARTAQHHSYDEIPESARNLPVFGLVRNPWDWYVSWYHFFMSYDYRPPHFMTVSRDKTLGFAEFMQNLRRFPVDSPEYRANSFSTEYFRIFGCDEKRPRNPDIQVGRYETVYDDVIAFFEEIGIDQACIDEVPSFRTMNPSPHKPYWTYYTDAVAEGVYESDRAVIDEFGYEFRAPGDLSPGS